MICDALELKHHTPCCSDPPMVISITITVNRWEDIVSLEWQNKKKNKQICNIWNHNNFNTGIILGELILYRWTEIQVISIHKFRENQQPNYCICGSQITRVLRAPGCRRLYSYMNLSTTLTSTEVLMFTGFVLAAMTIETKVTEIPNKILIKVSDEQVCPTSSGYISTPRKQWIVALAICICLTNCMFISLKYLCLWVDTVTPPITP